METKSGCKQTCFWAHKSLFLGCPITNHDTVTVTSSSPVAQLSVFRCPFPNFFEKCCCHRTQNKRRSTKINEANKVGGLVTSNWHIQFNLCFTQLPKNQHCLYHTDTGVTWTSCISHNVKLLVKPDTLHYKHYKSHRGERDPFPEASGLRKGKNSTNTDVKIHCLKIKRAPLCIAPA